MCFDFPLTFNQMFLAFFLDPFAVDKFVCLTLFTKFWKNVYSSLEHIYQMYTLV